MKKLIVIMVLMLPVLLYGGAKGAFRYPDVLAATGAFMVDENEDGISELHMFSYKIKYGLMVMGYKLAGINDDGVAIIGNSPYFIIYFDKKSEFIAIQHDYDEDKKIDQVSGNLKKLNKILDWLENR